MRYMCVLSFSDRVSSPFELLGTATWRKAYTMQLNIKTVLIIIMINFLIIIIIIFDEH